MATRSGIGSSQIAPEWRRYAAGETPYTPVLLTPDPDKGLQWHSDEHGDTHPTTWRPARRDHEQPARAGNHRPGRHINRRASHRRATAHPVRTDQRSGTAAGRPVYR